MLAKELPNDVSVLVTREPYRAFVMAARELFPQALRPSSLSKPGDFAGAHVDGDDVLAALDVDDVGDADLAAGAAPDLLLVALQDRERAAADHAMPTIAAPHTNNTAIAIAATARNRLIAACISVTRAGGSRTRAAGRRQNSMNAMPPIQTTTPSR